MIDQIQQASQLLGSLQSLTDSTLGFVMSLSGACAWASAVIPKTTDTSPTWYRIVRKVVDVMGANVRNAKNGDGKP